MMNFSDEGLHGSNNVKSTKSVGKLRIIGTVQKCNTIGGYMVFSESTFTCKMYTVEQTKSLIKRGLAFINAEVDKSNGEIAITENAVSRMPVYSIYGSVIRNEGYIVLREIVDENTLAKLGYVVLSPSGRVGTCTEEELVKAADSGAQLINAKLVSKSGKKYISAIKTEFTKMYKSELEARNAKRSENQKIQHGKTYLHGIYREKVKEAMESNILNMLSLHEYYSGAYIANKNKLRINNYDGRGYLGLIIDINKIIKVISKEIIPSFEDKITPSDLEVLRKLRSRVDNINKDSAILVANNYTINKKINNNKDTEYAYITMLGLFQFIVYDSTYAERINSKMSKHNILASKDMELPLIKKLSKQGLLIDKIKDMSKEVLTLRLTDKKRKDDRTASKKKLHHIDTLTFKTAKDIAQLGFAVTEANENFKFTTECGNKLTLHYLGNVRVGMTNNLYNEYRKIWNFDKYRAKARCLGDLATIAYIEKLLYKLERKEDYIKKIDVAIEMLIIIAYIYNSESVRDYVEANKDRIEELTDYSFAIPSYEEISGTDFKLDKDIDIYYESGFNVFLADDESKKSYDSEYINYRVAGVKKKIEHNKLNDLASVVNILSSDNVSANDIDDRIGRLRFL